MSGYYYVYILRSVSNPARYHVGFTRDLRDRLNYHNAGCVGHTHKYVPWCMQTAVAFRDRQRAFAFERYLKSASGRAFARKQIAEFRGFTLASEAQKVRASTKFRGMLSLLGP